MYKEVVPPQLLDFQSSSEMTTHLALAQAVLSNSELRLVTRERLSSSTNTSQDLAGRQAMLALQGWV